MKKQCKNCERAGVIKSWPFRVRVICMMSGSEVDPNGWCSDGKVIDG